MDTLNRREIMMDNYQNPSNREIPKEEGYTKTNTRNISCIDNLDLYILFDDKKIEDLKFIGEACAISTASASMMTKLLVGKTIDEAKEIIHNFENMIEHQDYNQSLLGEANAMDEIYKQDNRKVCALLPWQGIMKALNTYERSDEQ